MFPSGIGIDTSDIKWVNADFQYAEKSSNRVKTYKYLKKHGDKQIL